jgi:hypothetical protein
MPYGEQECKRLEARGDQESVDLRKETSQRKKEFKFFLSFRRFFSEKRSVDFEEKRRKEVPNPSRSCSL